MLLRLLQKDAYEVHSCLARRAYLRKGVPLFRPVIFREVFDSCWRAWMASV